MGKRILLVNKFFYSRGGAEIVTINLKDELQQRGYIVGVFTMDYRDNISQPNLYVASEVDFKGNIKEKIKFFRRTLGLDGVAKSFRKTLAEFNPDVVHLHNIHSYLSPIIGEIAKENGCRVVWTLHDYKLLCPAYSCLKNGEVCEACFYDKSIVLKTRCMKGSIGASLLAYLEAKKWNKERVEAFTDIFICPSQFIADKMIGGGFDKTKIRVLSNFLDPKKYEELKNIGNINKSNFYSYIGRLSNEKGIETLLKSASELPYTLKIAGRGPLEVELKKKYKRENIIFLGQLNAKEVSHLLEESRFTVSPSECYENNPLSVIESLCSGTPVIGSNVGGIPELVNNNNGYIFPQKDISKLKEKIEKAMTQSWPYEQIKEDAMKRFSSQKHFETIEKIYFPESI